MPLSNKEKMLAGELYFANDPELVAERRAAQRCLAQYNGTDADDQPGRMALLRQLFGAVGANPDILPRFHCDYGYNIRVGRNCFINYNCVFLDCAPIEIGDDLQMAPAVQLYAAYHPRANGIAERASAVALRAGLDAERVMRWAAIWAVGEATETWRHDSDELQRWVMSREAARLLAL